MYKILVSGLAYDNGKSGISDYINNTINQLSKDNQIELLLLEKDISSFPIKNKNIKIISVPNHLKKPIINMLWHFFILPFTIKKNKYDFIFLPAGNRRLMFFYPMYTITTVHDLSQFHIKNKYSFLRMIFIKTLIPAFTTRGKWFCLGVNGQEYFSL